MLNRACRFFRDCFEVRAEAASAEAETVTTGAGTGAEHRRLCPACDAWAQRLEEIAGSATPRPLPEALRRRLLAIPEISASQDAPSVEPHSVREPRSAPEPWSASSIGAVSCGDVDRLYEGSRRRAHGETPDAAVDVHLDACTRCATLYGALRVALAPRFLPIPASLVRRLAALGAASSRRTPVPWWIRDGRVAVAASLLLTAVLGLAAGEASARLGNDLSTIEVHRRAAAWAETGQLHGQAAVRSLAGGLNERARHGWAALAARGRTVAAFGRRAWDMRDVETLRESLKEKVFDLYIPQGDQDEHDGFPNDGPGIDGPGIDGTDDKR